MGSPVWAVATLLASFFVGPLMGMSPLDRVNAIENGIGGTLGFLAAVFGATAIVSPMLQLYPNVSPEIITIAIGSGAIGCTIVTDSLFWLVKQYCGASLNETFKYSTTATFIASVLALGGTFLLSFII